MTNIEIDGPGPCADGLAAGMDAAAHPFAVAGAAGGGPVVINPINDRIFGTAGVDHLHGGRGDDLLVGRRGEDRLFGRDGRDQLDGGYGRDRPADGRPRQGHLRVRVRDGRRHHGPPRPHHRLRGGDRIDLRAIDARAGSGADNAFRFIGHEAFSDRPGDLRYAGGLLRGDTDGDGDADIAIRLQGAPVLDEADFLL